jgi:hypothetical protein
MGKFRFTIKAVSFVIIALAAASTAQAQATRTWVSAVGDDVNPCSRTAPCKTFAGAISKTAAGGEISTLDPGGYGSLTITKSLTVDGGTGQGWASVLASFVNGIVVNDALSGSPNTVVVNLRHLSINGNGNGLDGIRFISGRTVHVESCEIFGFTGDGIEVALTGVGGDLLVKDTILVNNGTALKANTTGTGAANILYVTIDRSRADRNAQEGFRIENNVRASVSNSTASTNGLNGFVLVTTTTASEMSLDNCVASNNRQWGVFAGGVATTRARLSSTTAINNAVAGVQINAGGAVDTFGNNKIQGNGPAGVTNVSGGSLGAVGQS